ncbi:MAG: hypothetical protein ACLQC7_01700 [Thermoplasmata archaeon]
MAILVIASTVLVSGSVHGTPGVRSALALAGQGPSAFAPAPQLGGLPSTSPPVTVPTGAGPDSVLVDATNGTVFVASQFSDNVSAISVATDTILASIPVGSEPAPQAIALDTTNWTVYVVNSGSDNVSVISVAEDAVLSSVTVGATPDAVVVDSANHNVYVANGGSASVSIISPVTGTPHVIDNVPVGIDPDALAVDTITHNVFVATAGNDNVSVISGATNVVLKSITVGSSPGRNGAMVFDPLDGDIYVANIGSDNVSVIGGSNFTVFATIPVGLEPSGLVVDPAAKEVFVANYFSDNVSVISTTNNTVVASIPVGSDPAPNGAIAFNPTIGDVYVPNGGSNNVSVISVADSSVAATIRVGLGPDAVAADAKNGAVFVANQGSANVSVFVLSDVTFKAVGLPPGSTWSVSAGAPPVLRTNTTVRSKGILEFLEPNGTLSYTVGSPAGYGVSKVTGPRTPTQSSANLTGAPATFTITFGPFETLTFLETGLASGALWGVAIQPSLHHGGPAPQTLATHGASIAFTVVKDSWKYLITTSPIADRALNPHGAVAVGKLPVTKTIRFVLNTARVVFKEAGLVRGTLWQVNVTGPMNVSVSSTKGTIKLLLTSGTYHFVAWNFSGIHPHPAKGTFTVSAPHAPPVQLISFTSAPRHAGLQPGIDRALSPEPAVPSFAAAVQRLA